MSDFLAPPTSSLPSPLHSATTHLHSDMMPLYSPSPRSRLLRTVEVGLPPPAEPASMAALRLRPPPRCCGVRM